MKSPKDIQIADYAYDLPDERIAKYPLAERDASKLLIYDHGNVSHRHFRDLPDLLPEGSLLVMNNTRVIQARLHFRKESTAQQAQQGQQGALIEVFCLEPAAPNDYVLMFQQTSTCIWHCLVGNAKKWKQGALAREITLEGKALTLSAERANRADLSPKPGETLVQFTWNDPDVTWAQVLDACGELPIPPYLNRKTEDSDLRTYQTVYSKVKGSVAAPTAGLHFTPAVLDAIDRKGIERAEVTLHVGAGTFKPVKSERIEGHEMHSEWIYVPRRAVEALIRHNGECTAVGTTSVRTLESLYYIGKKIIANPDATEEELKVGQWEPYEANPNQATMATHPNLAPHSAPEGATNPTSPASNRTEAPSGAVGGATTSSANNRTEAPSGVVGGATTSSAYNRTEAPSGAVGGATTPPANNRTEAPSGAVGGADIRGSVLGGGVTSSTTPIFPLASLQAILSWMDRHHTDALHTSTQIIIAPGYQYHIVRRMVTNFHQPQSTLLLLVSAFVGDEHWREIYRYALDNDFRFLSYGDSSLLMP